MRNLWRNSGMFMLMFVVFFMPTASVQLTETTGSSEVLAASSEIPDDQTLRSLLNQAASAQYALNEPMTRQEAVEKISPYMTQKFAGTFLRERLVPEETGQGNGLWWIPGSDDMYLFVPDFAWDKRTEVSMKDGVLHVAQHYPAEQGPWEIQAHTETVILIKEQGKWKIDGIYYK